MFLQVLVFVVMAVTITAGDEIRSLFTIVIIEPI